MNNFEGIPLSQRLTQRPFSVPEALQLASALADALRPLHDRGVVHGALEPGLVIIDETGVSLRDGIAANCLTPYSAPEQIQDKLIDSRSDIFAFGAILYEILSGRKAFPAEGDELRAAILEQDPEPLAGEASGLARLVSRCLAKAPAQRWQRIQNVRMELKLLSAMARRAEQTSESQERRLQAVLRKEIEEVEHRLSARLSAIEVATFELHAKLEGEGERLSAANHETALLRSDIVALSGRVEESVQMRSTDAAAVAEEIAGVARRLDGIDRALAAHASSLESLGTAVTQSDDLIERLVDAFDDLERPVDVKSDGQAATAGTS